MTHSGKIRQRLCLRVHTVLLGGPVAAKSSKSGSQEYLGTISKTACRGIAQPHSGSRKRPAEDSEANSRTLRGGRWDRSTFTEATTAAFLGQRQTWWCKPFYLSRSLGRNEKSCRLWQMSCNSVLHKINQLWIWCRERSIYWRDRKHHIQKTLHLQLPLPVRRTLLLGWRIEKGN